VKCFSYLSGWFKIEPMSISKSKNAKGESRRKIGKFRNSEMEK
jgi:hypothetical protein